MVEENSQAKEKLDKVPVFASVEEELAFWVEHDPWEFPDYWQECEMSIKHKSLGWVPVDGRLLEP